MPADASAAAGGLLLEGVAVRPGAARLDDGLVPGEIVGVAGLDGHGQEEFLEILAGLRRPAAGRVFALHGDRREAVGSFKQAVRHGIAYLARDRRLHGIFPALSILDNFSMVSWRRDTRFGLIGRDIQRARYETWRERLEIVAPDPRAPITALSGGNQQKVLLARWLALGPSILLLNDPTRGVDQRTREILYAVFRDLARRQGLSLVILSTEIEEVLRLCDRVLVFRDGEVSARLSGVRMSNDSVIAAMFGQAA
ncbi:ATP-binding cassette domain-containing protein [Labrys monachus]|uniref:Ribose transport system ATP-binding protein n=1 Tax=Labrys monachus TaxID=217067 RepID=A0ABU0FJH4_9HYPH|nr:ATP-binding cassette domain-containing protein [Labrys monachus]MDQ0394759.1 ribose transport system ATP-binding protein [Labrys monachus]